MNMVDGITSSRTISASSLFGNLISKFGLRIMDAHDITDGRRGNGWARYCKFYVIKKEEDISSSVLCSCVFFFHM